MNSKAYYYFKELTFGSQSFLNYEKESRLSKLDIRETYKILSDLNTGLDDDKHPPIFIFSSGWRCGSTLLQRMVVSAGYLIWGEPLSESAVIANLFKPLLTIRSNYPQEDYYMKEQFNPSIKREWIANLTPELKHTTQATKSYIDTWCKKSALDAGAERWGIKEVRWPAEYAYIFKALYPNAKFIFLVRNPINAYASYHKHGKKWFLEYPEKPINNSVKYARMWNRLARSFFEHSEETGAILLKYEDLHKEDTVSIIESYLGREIDKNLIKIKVGSSYKKSEKPYIPKVDKFIIKKMCGETMAKLDYDS